VTGTKLYCLVTEARV